MVWVMTVLCANSIDSAISSLFGPSVKVVDRQRVSGRDINRAYSLELSSGECVFLKSNRAGLLDMFTAEAHGIEALRATGTIGAPEPLAVGTDENNAFLIMEYLSSAPRRSDYWETFGHELAMLHRAKCGPRFGFPTDNYIGSTPQQNAHMDSWVAFFRERRLIPQMKLAWRLLDERTRHNLTRITDRLDTLLPEPAFPSLIHGDLWSGNALCGPDGKAWILDPAAYVGHFEAELAMTELFGGFPERFYRAYDEVNPIDRGYADRRDLYNLYHLLNHLNLFGLSYLSNVSSIANRYA